MIDLIDMLNATEQERDWAQRWADFAIRRFRERAVAILRGSLDGGAPVKSRKALRMAVRRAEANLRSRDAIAADASD